MTDVDGLRPHHASTSTLPPSSAAVVATSKPAWTLAQFTRHDDATTLCIAAAGSGSHGDGGDTALAFGDDDVRALIDMSMCGEYNTTRVTTLTLRNCATLTTRGMALLARYLTVAFPAVTHLAITHQSALMASTSETANSANTTVTDNNKQAKTTTTNYLANFVENLRAHATLTHLDLSHNAWTTSHVRTLCRLVSDRGQCALRLTALSLLGTRFSACAGYALADAMTEPTSMTSSVSSMLSSASPLHQQRTLQYIRVDVDATQTPWWPDVELVITHNRLQQGDDVDGSCIVAKLKTELASLRTRSAALQEDIDVATTTADEWAKAHAARQRETAAATAAQQAARDEIVAQLLRAKAELTDADAAVARVKAAVQRNAAQYDAELALQTDRAAAATTRLATTRADVDALLVELKRVEAQNDAWKREQTKAWAAIQDIARAELRQSERDVRQVFDLFDQKLQYVRTLKRR